MNQNLTTPHGLNTQKLLISLILCWLFIPAYSQINSRLTDATISNKFVENNGQLMDMDGNAVPDVFFVAQFPQTDVFITNNGITLLFSEQAQVDTSIHHRVYNWERLDINLSGANIIRENIIAGNTNEVQLTYYNTLNPAGVEAQEHGFVRILNIYPGIDWEIYEKENTGIKYNFVVHAGANPNEIKLIYDAAIPITVHDDGSILMHTLVGEIIDAAPISYINDTGLNINTTYLLQTINEHKVSVTFNLADYDQSKTITIDPELHWATYYGGNKEECFNTITTDGNGNMIAVGWTDSPLFPTLTAGTFYQGTLGSVEDAMIVKFSPSEVRLWATFYGGDAEDWAYSVVTDASNNIFVTGETVSPTFPTYNAGTYYQGSLTGDEDVFVLKFNSAGTRLWATFYGGDNKEGGRGITVDASGNIFVTGYTKSSDFPKLNAGTFYQATMSGVQDAFILKFSNTGTRIWATYYGGTAFDIGNSIVCDAGNNIFVTGTTKSTNFPILNAGTFYQSTMAGDTDLYVLKFTNTGTRLWATYYGGTDADYGNSIITDANDNIYVGGWTSSSDFPTQDIGGYFQASLGGLSDAHILKFDNSGNRLWSSYLGGSAIEYADKLDMLATDFCGNIYTAIRTNSSDMPVYDAGCSSYFDAIYQGFGDIFITRFDENAIITWASYYGYDNEELNACIAVSQLDGKSLYMTGQYNEYDPGAPVPLVNPGGGAYYDGTHNGDDEAFIAKFIAVPLTVNTTNTNICGCVDMAEAIPDCGVAPYEYLWSDGETTAVITDLCPDVYTVTVTDADCNIVDAMLEIICPLPVDIISFTGKYENKKVLLQWEAVSQFNTDMYLIEKSSDGETFKFIGSVYAVGNSNTAISYSYVDEDITDGMVYYRLVSIDHDNNSAVKGIVSVEITIHSNNLAVTVVGSDLIQFSFYSENIGSGLLQILTLSGAVVYESPITVQQGNNVVNAKVNGLSAGVYFGRVINGGNNYSTDFMYLNR